MTPPPRPSGHGPNEAGQQVRDEGVRFRDLAGRREEDVEREKRRASLRSRFELRRLLQGARAAGRALRGSLWEFGPTRFLMLTGLGTFSIAVILAGTGFGTLGALPALLGFGLSLAALLYGALPPVASRIDELERPQWLAVWALLSVLFAFLGFSSVVVIVLVLFVAGFTATHVFWDLLNRLVLRSDRQAQRGVVEATGNPNPFLLTFTVIAAWSVGASFLMGYLRVHEAGPLGIAFLAAHVGLVVGLVPLQVHLLREARRPTVARWSLFRPRRLIRDAVFMAVAGAVVGAELSIASGSGVFSGIPTLALVLVLFGYLGVVGRQLASLRGRARPYHPLILPAFGMLLLFAPLVVLLSSTPGVLTRLYGASQAAGILTGVAVITLRGLWREKTRRLRERLEETIRERVTLEKAEAVVKDRYERIQARQRGSAQDGIGMTEATSRRQQRDDPHEQA